jgi:hypothetical protein
LPGGHEYYLRQVPGKNKEWIKVFLLGNYGTIADGRPVYPEWNDEIHCRPTKALEGLPLLLGFDYGLTPACAICQISPRGQLFVIDELFAKDMGIRQFARDIVRPHLSINYAGFSFQAVGDPSGNAGKDTEEKTCFMELAEEGIPCCPASSNNFVARRESVAKYLTRMMDGKPGLMLTPSATSSGGVSTVGISTKDSRYRVLRDSKTLPTRTTTPIYTMLCSTPPSSVSP